MNTYKYKVLETGKAISEMVVEIYANTQEEADELCENGDYDEIIDCELSDFTADKVIECRRL